jgi:leader peptidase (prepilin peptidase) / N-methyltransferase
MIENIYIIFVFVFGLIIGSFLNVLIYRLPREVSMFKKNRSFCPKCKKKLTAKELIPLFSFLYLGGKCSGCKQKISMRYPIVEFITGILFLLVFLRSGINNLEFNAYEIVSILYFWLIISILIAIFFIDLEHYIIPDSLIVVGSVASIIYLLIVQYIVPAVGGVSRGVSSKNSLFNLLFSERSIIHNSLFINHIIFAIIGVVFFGLIIVITKGKGMGMGDLKFSVLMGLVLGGKIIGAVYVAFILGAILGILMILLKKKKLKSMIPFGPFLVVGMLLGMFL